MSASHRSLRDDFGSCGIGCYGDLARDIEGVYGADDGGGFGGCTINPLRTAGGKLQTIVGYEQATGLTPEIYVCDASKGAEEVRP